MLCVFNLEHVTHAEPKFAINQTKSINERFELELHTYTHTPDCAQADIVFFPELCAHIDRICSGENIK